MFGVLKSKKNKTGVQYAGFELRLFASAADSFLIALLLMPFVGVFLQPDPIAADIVSRYSAALITQNEMLLRMEQYLFFEGGFARMFMDTAIQWAISGVAVVWFWIARSATPGKMLFRMRVVDAATLGKPSPARLILRYIGYILAVLPLGLGFLWIIIDKRKQGWHDKLAGTVVIMLPREKKEKVHEENP